MVNSLLLAAAVLALVPLLPAPPGEPDVVEFTNGSSLEGEVLSETETDVTVRVDGGQVTLEKRLVKAIRRGGAGPSPAAAGLPPVEAAGAAPATPPPLAAVLQGGEYWSLLWSPERRVGWRHVQVRNRPEGSTFEEEAVFIGPDGKVEAATRLLEEAGPGLVPVSFLFRESVDGRELTRSGRVAGGRLRVETFLNGESSVADHPLPAGFRLPLAVRAFVLGEFDRLPGGWKGVSYDPRGGEFLNLSLRCTGTERIPWEGRTEEVCVLRRERAGVVEEERVTGDGRALTADLNGPGLVAVATTRERVEAIRTGGALPESEEEKRARTAYVSPEDGFRIFKPGSAWTFIGPSSASGSPRLVVKDVTGLVFLTVTAEPGPAGGDDAPPAALGTALERRLRASSGGIEKLEDGYGTLAGRPAYRLLCDAVLKGDRVRTLAWTFTRAGRTWTLAASAPADTWDEARPYLERILGGFEWL